MPTIQKPALQNLTQDLIQKRQNDPAVKVDGKVLDQILSIVGDSATDSSARIADKLKAGNLMPEEKLALVKRGLSDSEKQDIQTLLAHPEMAPMLDPVSENFLKALVGLEALKPMDAMGGSARVDAVGRVGQNPALAAVQKMRELVKSGQLDKYYDAAIGIGDPALKDEAMKLFESLPKVPAEATADDFVAAGLWTTKPRGIEAMEKSARYLPGRQVLVPTTVNTNTGDYQNFLSFQEDGNKALTYRATLAGEDGDNYLVKVDGRNDPVSIPKEEIHRLNQPNAFSGDQIRMAKTADYQSPFMKAKIAEAAILMDEVVGQIDFTKVQTGASGGAIGALFGRGRAGKKTSELQRKCVKIVHDVINMKYPKGPVYNEPGRNSGSDAGRLAVCGIGSCYMQGSVMAGLLAPFRKSLGVDVQFMSGGVYRNTKTSDPADKQFNSFNREAHGWLQLTYRPSMELRICDRTWQQPDHPADRAYSKWGDRYPKSRYRGLPLAPVTATDVNLSGNVSVETFDRQFGRQGVDGRDNHMSNSQ